MYLPVYTMCQYLLVKEPLFFTKGLQNILQHIYNKKNSLNVIKQVILICFKIINSNKHKDYEELLDS